MPKLSEIPSATILADARAAARTHVLPGLWQGGRLFENEFGEPVFLPIGQKRSVLGVAGPLRFVGDAVRNLRGWGEVYLLNPAAEIQ
jgi:hypothetical protein